MALSYDDFVTGPERRRALVEFPEELSVAIQLDKVNSTTNIQLTLSYQDVCTPGLQSCPAAAKISKLCNFMRPIAAINNCSSNTVAMPPSRRQAVPRTHWSMPPSQSRLLVEATSTSTKREAETRSRRAYRRPRRRSEDQPRTP